MRYIILAFFSFITNHTIGQKAKNPNIQNQIIKNVYDIWSSRITFLKSKCDTFYYTENLDSSTYNSVIKTLSANHYYQKSLLYNADEYKKFHLKSIQLTNGEQDYLLKQLKSIKEFNWSAKLFPNSKKLSQKEADLKIDRSENIKKRTAIGCDEVYSFSIPVFFRNKTVCLFIDQLSTPAFQDVNCYFYEKLDNNWIRCCKVFLSHKIFGL